MERTPGVLLSAAGLSLGYADRVVLRNITLTVRSGEFWFFLGPNGSGKTTLLRAFLGLLPPRGGVLETRPASARIGFVPQRCAINPTLPVTVREFVSLGLAGTRLPRRRCAEQLDWALGQVGLRALARRNYGTLSGGQRQRALVARALARRPTLLMLDEPTSNLDPTTERDFLHSLTEFQRTEGGACLFVTHTLSFAERHATHIGLVTEGTLIAGPRADVLTEPNLDRVYGRGRSIHVHVERDRAGAG